ncbi:HSP70/90 co-chaperone [Coemansia biformis]|uniref:HSP70/90 co-chaperone n=1 Tax=Coemansia biformis TaxID=1286918 RepID=A0A9W8CZP7_9FUNG|nr:HSP70/90 co-chaperone [Coemansia biformis]
MASEAGQIQDAQDQDAGIQSPQDPAVVHGPARTTVSDAERMAKLEKDMESMPLFMTRLPEEDEGSVAVEALKSLVSDEPPEEMSSTLKDEGNLFFKRGRFREAVSQYTQALRYDHDNKDLEVTLLINRAAANLELQNYGKVLHDCSRALSLRQKTPKALFRAAKACIALEKFDEAFECCRWAMDMEPENKELVRLQAQTEEARRLHEQRVKVREAREREREAAREMLRKAVEIRDRLAFDMSPANRRKDVYPWECGEYQVELDRETGHLLWPVAFQYPESKESDLVQRFDEAASLRDMLAQVLEEPPHWDDRRRPKYTLDNVDTYFLSCPVGGTDRDERLVKVGSSTPLATILDSDKYVIRDGIPSFLVLPRGDPFTAKFIDYHRSLRLAREAAVTKANAAAPAPPV